MPLIDSLVIDIGSKSCPNTSSRVLAAFCYELTVILYYQNINVKGDYMKLVTVLEELKDDMQDLNGILEEGLEPKYHVWKDLNGAVHVEVEGGDPLLYDVIAKQDVRPF